jgi:uncharacterized membrane protein
MNKSRLEAFTDAVIAIIMTILVLELRAPVTDEFNGLWDIRHKIVIYLLSFFSLAIYWNNHHHLFQISKRINGRVLWVNMLFILGLSMFPFATAWVGEHFFSTTPEIFYGIIILFTNVCYAILAIELIRVNGINSDIAHLQGNYKKTKISLALNTLGIIFGFFISLSVIISNAIVLMLWLIPEKKIEQYYKQLEKELEKKREEK